MPETRPISIKGRQAEFGPALNLPAAADIVYAGRRCSMGGWRLADSPYRNPYTVQAHGSAEAAVAEYARYLDEHRDLIKQAREELKGKRLACFCRDVSRCHTTLLCRLVDADARDVLPILRAAGATHPESPDAYSPHRLIMSMAGGPR